MDLLVLPAYRYLAIDLHLFSLAVAVIGIALGDWALLAGARIERERLRLAGGVVAAALAGLWLSGLWITAIDTGLQWAQITARPKLVVKLLVVSLLSLNGLALHRWAFPRLFESAPPRRLKLPLALGAASLSGWGYAGFLGLAGALTPMLGGAGFLLGFVIVLSAALALTLGPLRPLLTARLGRTGAHGGATPAATL